MKPRVRRRVKFRAVRAAAESFGEIRDDSRLLSSVRPPLGLPSAQNHKGCRHAGLVRACPDICYGLLAAHMRAPFPNLLVSPSKLLLQQFRCMTLAPCQSNGPPSARGDEPLLRRYARRPRRRCPSRRPSSMPLHRWRADFKPTWWPPRPADQKSYFSHQHECRVAFWNSCAAAPPPCLLLSGSSCRILRPRVRPRMVLLPPLPQRGRWDESEATCRLSRQACQKTTFWPSQQSAVRRRKCLGASPPP